MTIEEFAKRHGWLGNAFKRWADLEKISTMEEFTERHPDYESLPEGVGKLHPDRLAEALREEGYAGYEKTASRKKPVEENPTAELKREIEKALSEGSVSQSRYDDLYDRVIELSESERITEDEKLELFAALDKVYDMLDKERENMENELVYDGECEYWDLHDSASTLSVREFYKKAPAGSLLTYTPEGWTASMYLYKMANGKVMSWSDENEPGSQIYDDSAEHYAVVMLGYGEEGNIEDLDDEEKDMIDGILSDEGVVYASPEEWAKADAEDYSTDEEEFKEFLDKNLDMLKSFGIAK